MRSIFVPLRCLCVLLVVGCSSSGRDTGSGDCEIPGEGCECEPGVDTEVSCFDGEGALVGVGACEKGIRSCDADTAQWGACEGQRLSASEDCDSVDNDCDGTIDEGVDNCQQLIHYPGACVMTSDIGVDGTIDQRWTFTYDANHRLVEELHDAQDDGVFDTRFVFMRDTADRIIERRQFDPAGALGGVVAYVYEDGSNRLDELLHSDAAGTPTRRVDYIYAAGLNIRQDHDIGVDGTLDERWFYYHDEAGTVIHAERERTLGVIDFSIDYLYDSALNPVEYAYDSNGDGTVDERRFSDYSCWIGILTP